MPLTSLQLEQLFLRRTALLKKWRVQKKASIKVNCPAKITKTSLFSGRVIVQYAWIHENHDPMERRDLSQSRLPQNIRDWIHQQVQSNIEWKAIKATLRLSEQSLDSVSYGLMY